MYFLGLSYRNTAKALSFLHLIKISHVSIWNWIQKYKPQKLKKKKNIDEYIIDETIVKTDSELIWLQVVIEPKDREILSFHKSKERNMFVASERFLSSLVNDYGEHPVSTDGSGAWYPQQACKFLNLHHHIHSSYEKSIIERTMQYIKDRTETFNDYFPCRKKTNAS